MEIYETVFNGELSTVWAGTPFFEELPVLSYARACGVFLEDGHYGNEWRRELMFEACKPLFASDDVNDLIVKAKDRIPNDNQLVKRIINNLCLTYSQGATRELGRNASEIISDEDLNYYLEQADKISFLTGSCLIRPYFYKDELRFFLFKPDSYRCKYDEYGEITEVWLTKNGNKSNYNIERYIERWTPEIIYKDKEEVENPYGFLPFIELKANDFDADFNYNDNGNWELCELQIFSNILDLVVMENSILGSVGVWLGNNLKTRESNIKLSPAKMILAEADSLEEAPKLEYVSADMTADIIQELKASWVKDKLKDYGLPSSVLDEGGVLSGTAMQADRLELLEQRKRRINLLKKFDKELIELISQVAEIDGYDFEPDHTIVFNDLENINDPIEELDVLEKKYQLGLISKIDMLRALGHTGTDKELNQKLREINEQRNLEQGTSSDTGGAETEANAGNVFNENREIGERNQDSENESEQVGEN